MKRLNVLVACEYSGRVRDAFAALGHNAMSCDLLPRGVVSHYHCTVVYVGRLLPVFSREKVHLY